MREKIINKINSLYICYSITAIVLVVLFFIFRKHIDNHLYFVIPCSIVFIIGAVYINNYRQEHDKRYITKCVIDNKFSLARINKASLSQVINESISCKNKLFDINLTIIDSNLKEKNIKIIDQFSFEQENIPNGYIYVTDDGNEGSQLIIPMIVIQKYATSEDKINMYEKNVKNLNYLNVLYNKGLIIESYEDSLKRSNEYRKK